MSSGTVGGMENPSSTDSPSVSRDSAGLRRVGGTPSICMMTERQRNRITTVRTLLDRVLAIQLLGRLSMTKADYSLSIMLATETGVNPSIETVSLRTRVVYWLPKGLRKRAHSLFVSLPPGGGRDANSPCLYRGSSPLRQALGHFQPIA